MKQYIKIFEEFINESKFQIKWKVNSLHGGAEGTDTIEAKDEKEAISKLKKKLRNRKETQKYMPNLKIVNIKTEK